jgi:hypothetical protein
MDDALALDKRFWSLWYLTHQMGDSRPLLAWHVPRARALERILDTATGEGAKIKPYQGRVTHSTAWYKQWTHVGLVLPAFTVPFYADPAWPALSDPLIQLLTTEFEHAGQWSAATWLRAAQLAVDAHRPDMWNALRARVPDSLWSHSRFRFAWYASRAWVPGPTNTKAPDKVVKLLVENRTPTKPK